VIVHVGMALSRISPEDAAETFRYLDEMQELAELDGEQQAIERAEVP
jgi:hydrogenase maturation factor